jgi:hypothetical protein
MKEVLLGSRFQVAPASVLLKTPIPLTASALEKDSPVQKYMMF